ncbi:MAG: hypothetical protein ACK4SL_02955 [Candidatus Paceibacteria bacterium]
MKPDIDIIVKDLLAQNPDLEIEAGVLRVLVADMLAGQPTVSVDPAFRARLRAELTRRAPVVKEKRLALPWWLIYTLPVGVTAILLLVVQPPQKVLPPSAPIPTSTNTEIYSAPTDVAPAMIPTDMDMGASKRGGETVDDAATSASFAEDARMYQAPAGTNDSFTAVFTPDRKAIRFSSISVSAPAFVQITGARGGELVTGLIPPGERTNFVLPIGRTASRGETYTATLYYDNGDGMFLPQEDALAYDTTGMPITLTLIAK